jgi:hypothetical protein
MYFTAREEHVFRTFESSMFSKKREGGKFRKL